jgi:3-phenylpropionate/trans-cinnamate dioxygenase ferredoxin subunit
MTEQINQTQYEFYQIAETAELPSGERLFIELDGKPVVVFNLAGHYYAIDDVCTHDDGPVGEGEVSGFTITCPRHGARFDLRNGKALALPAVVDVNAYPVREKDGWIEIGVPAET